jgi:hypothetical protein
MIGRCFLDTKVLSEDLNAGQGYGGVVAENPFEGL